MTSPIHTSRTVDLGREDELVPWAEWFVRSAAMLEHLVKQGQAPQGPRVFRVTLADGRPFAVMSVQKHVARGKCEVVEGEGVARELLPSRRRRLVAPLGEVLEAAREVGQRRPGQERRAQRQGQGEEERPDQPI